MKSIAVLALGALAIGGGVLAASAPSSTPAAHPVVVELFTSQGCSSCPPADAVLARLAGDPGVIAISRPVTYWDRLGWKDTLARPENTRLQQAYASHGGSGAGVYTPQAVVQGGVATVGSREAMLRGLVAQAARRAAPQLGIARIAGGHVVSIAGRGTRATVSLVALRSRADVAIGSGENGGRRVRYTNVVVGERRLGSWAGGSARYAVPAAAMQVAGADRYAVIVQQEKAGPIVAARYF